MVVKLKYKKGKGISAAQINAVAARGRKWLNKIKGFKFGTDRVLGKDGKGTAKKPKSGGGEKTNIQKVYKKMTYEIEAAARATKKLKAEINSLMSKSELSASQRKTLEALKKRMNELGSKSAIKAYASQSGAGKGFKGYDPSKDVPKTKEVDHKAELKAEQKAKREKRDEVRAEGKAKIKEVYPDSLIRKAKGIASRHAGADYDGALKKIEALKPGLSAFGEVQKALAKSAGAMARGGMAKKAYGTAYRSGGAVTGKVYGSVDNRRKR